MLTHVARVGLIAYGVMHFLIGYLAIRLAWGLRGADADQTGALQTVADGPGGTVLLWAIGLGMLALALWQAGEVLLWWPGLLDPAHRKRTAVRLRQVPGQRRSPMPSSGSPPCCSPSGWSTRPTNGCATSPTRRWTSPAEPCWSAASRSASSPWASTRSSAASPAGS